MFIIKLSKWNNEGMVYKTKKCLDFGIDLIKDDPLNYFSIVKFNFISTHGHFAFDHRFKPYNWDKYFIFFDQIKENKLLNSIKVRLLQIYYFSMYLFFSIILLRSFFNSTSFSKENFFNEALKLFKKEKYDDARFLFERNIVFNPKDANSYLYLAKIYNQEENQRKEEYNLETTLLIEPDNEEALLMLIKIALKKSNYEKVEDLSDNFVKVCKNLCDENKDIQESLKNIEPENNES